MTDIGKFTEPKYKIVSLLPWNNDFLNLKFKKNDSWALNIEILYLGSSH